MKFKKAFTLIELLVVISIIALLLAILMPALGRVKEMARATVCNSNMRQLNVGWHTYAADNEGKIPGATVHNPLENEWIQTNEWDWVWAPWNSQGRRGGGPVVNDPALEFREEGIRLGSLFPYTKDVDLYHCPSDKSKNFRTYSIPDSLNGTQNWGWSHINRKVQIRRPSSTYIFVEEYDGRSFNRGSWVLGPYKESWHDPIAVWHNGDSNFAFADGHVEKIKLSAETVDAFRDLREHPGHFTPETEEGGEDLEYVTRGWPEL